MTMRPIADTASAALGDHRRYPGCRVLVVCTGCEWAKDYNPERVIDRLNALKAGGHRTVLTEVARRVSRRCPRCHEVGWRAQFAWPANLSEREIKRLANLYRN
jgi:hypothetical protein